jgi:hypothetical protein
MVEITIPQFPCPVPPKPPIARQHCRHYSYRKGLDKSSGPECALGVNLDAPGACLACMPPDSQRGKTCAHREDWTEEERAAWKSWQDQNMLRMLVCLEVIPGASEGTGKSGELPCPACGTGTIRWTRSPGKGHLHAGCSTKDCFAVMQ